VNITGTVEQVFIHTNGFVEVFTNQVVLAVHLPVDSDVVAWGTVVIWWFGIVILALVAIYAVKVFSQSLKGQVGKLR